jgi:aminoglycoside phosphotransferase (APT) family kinase protein
MGSWRHRCNQSPGKRGLLNAVIDFGCAGIGDPSCDLVIAWTFLDEVARDIFRPAVMLDTAAWKRARGWAVWKATITLVQLRDTNAIEAEKQRRIIREVLDDHSRASKQAE